MKLLKTTTANIVKYCQDQFGFKLPSELITCTYRIEFFKAKLHVFQALYKSADPC